MDTLAFVLQALLGGALAVAGLLALAGHRSLGALFTQARLPGWLRLVAGTLALLGGAVVLAGFAIPPLTAFGAILLALLLLAALLVALTRLRRPGAWLAPAALLALAVGVVYLRPLGVQILALPQQAAATAAPVEAELVAAFPAGTFLESVAQDAEGNLFLAHTTGVDLGGDTSATRGTVLRIAPNGTQHTVAALPAGAFAGVLALARDGSIFLTVNSPSDAQAHGVWRIAPDGAAVPFGLLPLATQPNGIALGPDGALFVADSAQGIIWRVDEGGQATPWLADPQLAARPWLALFPGANGIQRWQDALYVAVSDRGQILRVPLLPDGTPGPLSVYARGLPTDDFAFDAAGNLYATTHPYNSVVRVSPTGERTLLAGAAEGVLGPTDASFGTASADQSALFVVTDGGLLEGRPLAEQRPALLRLDVGAPGAAATP